ALEPSDRIEAGPARLLEHPGFMRSEWDGETRLIPPGRALPSVSPSSGICHAWQKLTGDAGWAGVLAESFQKDPQGLAYIIYRPGQDPLPLIAEALGLLPEKLRWNV